jgi:hypothetical protein
VKGFYSVFFCALVGILGLSGCGSGSNRQLLSLTINPQSATAQNGQAQFVATGHFNTAPTTVTPMPVAWNQSFPAFDPPGQVLTFSTTQQPFAGQCFPSQQTITVVALAPVNASASGNVSVPLPVFMDLVINRSTTEEGGFVAATAQLSCP